MRERFVCQEVARRYSELSQVGKLLQLLDMAVFPIISYKVDPRNLFRAQSDNRQKIRDCGVLQTEGMAVVFGLKVLKLFHELRVWRDWSRLAIWLGHRGLLRCLPGCSSSHGATAARATGCQGGYLASALRAWNQGHRYTSENKNANARQSPHNDSVRQRLLQHSRYLGLGWGSLAGYTTTPFPWELDELNISEPGKLSKPVFRKAVVEPVQIELC